jgi:hypothetical protein
MSHNNNGRRVGNIFNRATSRGCRRRPNIGRRPNLPGRPVLETTSSSLRLLPLPQISERTTLLSLVPLVDISNDKCFSDTRCYELFISSNFGSLKSTHDKWI